MSNFFKQKEKTEKEIKRDIKKSYKRVSNNLVKRLSLVNPDTITYDYLRQTAKYLEGEYKRLNKRLIKNIETAITTTVEGYTQSQIDFYSELCEPLATNFQDMFSKVNEIALDKVISGKIYDDNIKLSDRVWGNNKKTIQTINDILTDGFVSKKSSKDIAKDLEAYVNPDYKQEYDRFTIHPKSKNKVEFNSYRLANTYINHAYQTATIESAKHNPFVETVTWLSGDDKRVCELCAERNGKHFEKDKVPLDHPLGRCTLLTDVGDLEDIARELRSWVDGKPNEKLDNWFKEYEVDEPNKTVNKEPKLEIIREEDAKTYKKYTEKEINNFAQNNEKILNKHISKQSKWSGKIIVNDRKRIYGKLWSCDICVYPELSPMIIMHEQIHARSVSYYDKRIYEEFQKIEEATVQFATQEICGKEGIEILESGYDELIDILRELNEMANLYDNNYDFAIDLINLDLPNRLNWLETTMYNIFIKKGNLNDMVKFNELISELYGGIE